MREMTSSPDSAAAASGVSFSSRQAHPVARPGGGVLKRYHSSPHLHGYCLTMTLVSVRGFLVIEKEMRATWLAFSH